MEWGEESRSVRSVWLPMNPEPRTLNSNLCIISILLYNPASLGVKRIPYIICGAHCVIRQEVHATDH